MEKVKDIMSKNVVTFSENSKLIDIAKSMGAKNISCVVITKNKIPIGIITERDMTKTVVAKNLDAKKTEAIDVMSSPVISIEPETNIYYAKKLMKEKNFRRFPVTKNKKLIGLITKTDLVDYFAEQRKKFVLKSLNKSLRKKYPF